MPTFFARCDFSLLSNALDRCSAALRLSSACFARSAGSTGARGAFFFLNTDFLGGGACFVGEESSCPAPPRRWPSLLKPLDGLSPIVRVLVGRAWERALGSAPRVGNKKLFSTPASKQEPSHLGRST